MPRGARRSPRSTRSHRILKKGLALTPVKFGISFTTTHLNQAGALVLVYADGSIHLNHGGTEMGQGLMIKVAQVVADVFAVPIDSVKISATRTDKVPNTSATAASSGADLNGMAAKNAAETIQRRASTHFAATAAGARRELDASPSSAAAPISRASRSPRPASTPRPKIHYDRASHRGRPFLYFAYGAALSEVVIDTLTGEHRVVAVDILHDVGRSLNPAIDLGQIEGGFIQGMGWLTTEELVFDERGRLLTHAPSTYKIPTASDRPARMDMRIWERGRECRGDDPPLQGGRRAAADARHLGLLGADPGGRRRRARQGAAEARRPGHARAHPGRDRRAQGPQWLTGPATPAKRCSQGPAALVTILATEGSAPRGPGARMVVTETGLAGTIGGGTLEHQATAQARAILALAPGSWRVQDYPLGPLLGQCCGGRVRLLVEQLGDVPDGDGPFEVHAGRDASSARPARRRGRGARSARGPGCPTAGARFVEPAETRAACRS